jgi:hypothetical protein
MPNIVFNRNSATIRAVLECLRNAKKNVVITYPHSYDIFMSAYKIDEDILLFVSFACVTQVTDMLQSEILKAKRDAMDVPNIPPQFLSDQAMVFLNIPMDAETPSMRLLRPQARAVTLYLYYPDYPFVYLAHNIACGGLNINQLHMYRRGGLNVKIIECHQPGQMVYRR